MGFLTFSINLTLDGCVDHQEGIADDETHAVWPQGHINSRGAHPVSPNARVSRGRASIASPTIGCKREFSG